jgi:hypothetical protein
LSTHPPISPARGTPARHRENPCLPDLIEPVYLARMVLFPASDDAALCTANTYVVEARSI